MKLLLDIGNTRLKWAYADGQRLSSGEPLAYADEDLAQGLLQRWTNAPTPDAVWAASVAGAKRERGIEKSVHKIFGKKATFARTAVQACGVRNAYPEPARLGIDRFLSLVALHHRGARACVHAACGTALVLDALGADGQHHGGLIAPSPELMQRALLRDTARIKMQAPAHLVELARSTEDAVHSGTWLAAASLVERFVAHSAGVLGGSPQLILSGGAAIALQRALGGSGEVQSELVLHGLAIYADQPAD